MTGLLAQPRVRLANLPTPLHHAERLSAQLGGPRIVIKRDDLTGLATGGNKTRKLEYLVADALAQDATHLVTEGAAQSNHCRQTAAAAARVGLPCVLVLNHPDGAPPLQGNLLLDKLVGATWHVVPKGGAPRRAAMNELADKMRAEGHRPYVIPTGGSNGVGALGYAGMILELQQQLRDADLSPAHLFCGVCSGGTHAGLALGAAMFGVNYGVTGVLASDTAEECAQVAFDIARESCERMGIDCPLRREDVDADDAQVGEGYGIPTPASLEAIDLLARTEGILLDPVYSSKGFAGLLAAVRAGRFGPDDTVVFVHTGGQASLFAKVDAIRPILEA